MINDIWVGGANQKKRRPGRQPNVEGVNIRHKKMPESLDAF